MARPRRYIQHGSRHRPLGTDPIPGLGVGPCCVISQEDTGPNIHAVANYNILWDTIYDNAVHFHTITSLPDGLGLSIAFDGSSPKITATEDGFWTFDYTLRFNSPDATYLGAMFIENIVGPEAWIQPSASVINQPVSGSSTTFIPSGDFVYLNLATLVASTASPFLLRYATMLITRLG